MSTVEDRTWHSNHRGAYRRDSFPTFLHRGDARCFGTDPDAFFPDKGALPAPQVVKLCETCPLQSSCREWAIGQGNWLVGYWGGTTPRLRRKIRECRVRRGRAGVCRHGAVCPFDVRYPTQEAA